VNASEGSMMNSGMFSSETDEWSTPQSFYDKLNNKFKFDLDVCALPSSAKCEVFFTPEDDGLNKDWFAHGKTIWMNPPYGREIGKWMQKACVEANKGCTVVCLVPARVDTKWWYNSCQRGEISFVKGRLKFGGATNSAPFPSAVVVLRPSLPPFIERY